MRAIIAVTVIAASLLSLPGCISASPEKVDGHFLAWQSAQVDELIQAWGVPQQSREIAGKHYAEWTKQEIASKPTFSIGLGGFGGNVGGSVGTTMGGGQKHNFCSVQAEHDADGRVSAIRWSGDTDICVDSFAARVR